MAIGTTEQTVSQPEPDRSLETESDQCVVMHGLDWKGYLTLLRLRGERPRPRVLYLDGEAWLVSPSSPHEVFKKRFGNLVSILVEERGLPCVQVGSTTFRRRLKRGGVEGDEAFYLAHAADIQHKVPREKIDLRTDPPPDLAIEVVHTRASDTAIAIWKRIQVPELWAFDDPTLKILIRKDYGRYVTSETSLAFPALTADEISSWIGRPPEGSDTDWIKALRAWVKEVIVPRVCKPEK